MISRKYKKTATIISFIAILSGFFFLSGSITGLSVVGMNDATSSSVGIILLVIGVVAAFFALRK